MGLNITGNSFACYEIPCFYVGVLEANQDMSAQPTAGLPPTFLYTPVAVVAATGTGLTGPAGLAPVATSGAMPIGILQTNPQLAEAGSVMVHGVTKALINSAVTIGQKLMAIPVGSASALVPATSGNFACAIALNAGAGGDYIPVLLLSMGKQ